MASSIYVRNIRFWREYNHRRTERAISMGNDRHKRAFTVIPFLLNYNHYDLPGYVPNFKFCCGIHGYEPSKETISAAEAACPDFKYNKLKPTKPDSKPFIESLLLMGSIGTAAQTEVSDLDYWVVVDEPSLSIKTKEALLKKLDAISLWAAKSKIEVHFFLSDIAKTKANNFGKTDKESSGSTQANILKEEFYRTSILLSGKIPLWWALPPGLSDDLYEEHKENLFREGYIKKSDLIDLGNANKIPEEEFFGAILWQFNKALVSPHKSALKMALLESMAAELDRELPCDELKAGIQSLTPTGIFDDDPYLIMIERIHDFYERADNKDSVSILEQCFFIKSLGDPIEGMEDGERFSYKERGVRACLRKWGWDDSLLSTMNYYPKWEFSQCSYLANSLHNFMIETYKRVNKEALSGREKKSLITDTDLTLIGRKLFTLYSHKQNKVEYLKRVRDEHTNIESVSFVAPDDRKQLGLWKVYKSNVISSLKRHLAVEHLQLKKSSDPVFLMMWLLQNRIVGKHTYHYLEPGKSPLFLSDIQRTMGRMLTLFPPVDLASMKANDLLNQAKIERSIVVVNLLSQRWVDEIEHIHILFRTSWGESYCYRSKGYAGLNILLKALKLVSPKFSLADPNCFDVVVPRGELQSMLKRKTMDYLNKHFARTKY